MTSEEAYVQGFVSKCAQEDVDPKALMKEAQLETHATKYTPMPAKHRKELARLTASIRSSGGDKDLIEDLQTQLDLDTAMFGTKYPTDARMSKGIRKELSNRQKFLKKHNLRDGLDPEEEKPPKKKRSWLKPLAIGAGGVGGVAGLGLLVAHLLQKRNIASNKQRLFKALQQIGPIASSAGPTGLSEEAMDKLINF